MYKPPSSLFAINKAKGNIYRFIRLSIPLSDVITYSKKNLCRQTEFYFVLISVFYVLYPINEKLFFLVIDSVDNPVIARSKAISVLSREL